MLRRKPCILKFRNYIFPNIFLFFTIGLILFSNNNLIAAKTRSYIMG